MLVRPLIFAILCGSVVSAVHAGEPHRAADADKAVATEHLESSVLAELNRLRSNPAAYARHLEEMRAQYHGNLLVRGAGLAPIRTVEGVGALDEAIAHLKTAPASVALTSTKGLTFAARDMVADEGPTGVVGHKGTDGSNSFQRISRHGKSKALSGEVIDYGWDTARDIVVDLLIDDGIANRGHRRAVLDPLYAQAGVSCGPHAKFNVMCVVEMAEDYEDGSALALVEQPGVSR